MMGWLRRGQDRPTLMDRYLPTYDIRIGQHTLVRATPADIYAAVQRLDALIADDPLVRALSAVRLVPLRLARLLRRRSRGARWPAPAPAAATAAAPPFVPLAQQPGAEIVFGLIGQFWTKGFGYQRVAPRAFAAFNRPGFAKVALNFAVHAQRDGRSLLTSETRVATTDMETGRRFRRYWLLIGPGARVLMRRLLVLIKAEAEQAARRRSAAAALPAETRSLRWTGRMMGKAALGLGAGALGVLTAHKVRDDRYVDGLWQVLEQSGSRDEPFMEEMVAGLPDPARRYFLHAIQPGTRLASRLHWSYCGRITPGKGMPWLSLRAVQILAKERGFVWKSRARKGPLVVTASDHYLDGEGRMRIALFGLVPVINATGPDLSKSALGRRLIEGCALPSALLPGPHVQIEGIDASRFKVMVSLHGQVTPLTLTVDQEGRLKELVLERCGNLTADGSYRYIPYGGTADEERTFGGYTIPTRLAIGWWYGTEQYLEVIRLRVNWAQLD